LSIYVRRWSIGVVLCAAVAVGLGSAPVGNARLGRTSFARHIVHSGIDGETALQFGTGCKFPPGTFTGCLPPQPIPATILVRTTGCHPHRVAEIHSNGNFRQQLPPGTYLLLPRASGTHKQSRRVLRVRVRRGRFTYVLIPYVP